MLYAIWIKIKHIESLLVLSTQAHFGTNAYSET